MAKFRAFNAADWQAYPGALKFSDGREPLIITDNGVTVVLDRLSIQTMNESKELMRLELPEHLMAILHEAGVMMALMAEDPTCETCGHRYDEHDEATGECNLKRCACVCFNPGREEA